MNRLIIVGNGFDLAHNLPTSYRSFINFIWKNFHNLSTIPKIKKLFHIQYPFHDNQIGITMRFNDYKDFYFKVRDRFDDGNYIFTDTFHGKQTFKIHYKNPYSNREPVLYFDFQNKFFELITVQNAENWVDIENTYYEILVSLLKKEGKYDYIGNVSRLNEEFAEIKDLLEFYLTESIENGFEFTNSYSDSAEMCDIFEYSFKNLYQNREDKYFLEFPPSYNSILMEFDEGFEALASRKSSFENLFLDFNYTSTILNYVDILNKKNKRSYGLSSHIQIHGKLNDLKNQINFGFGDEMDDNYKLLEKSNDNEFLENIKSFMYLSNSNYRRLLQWIESADFQVFVMGHSCGLSDRTLLNTVFEHNNCKSIKVFYHRRSDGSDNFKELSQNISRHFNKKALMRGKVVDKSLSEPLPQNIRFNKLNTIFD